MAKHHPDLIMCRKQPGIAIGRLCEKCDGKCVICDSYVRCVTPRSHTWRQTRAHLEAAACPWRGRAALTLEPRCRRVYARRPWWRMALPAGVLVPFPRLRRAPR